MNNSKFYNGDKIVSLLDINGKKPGMYVIIGNRTSGKTTYFNSRSYRLWKKKKYRKIGFIYRYKYELEDAAVQFFNPISFRFRNDSISQGKINQRGYVPLYSNDQLLGYGLALNSADSLKKVSNVFNEIDCLIWDEFQSVDGKYCSDEMDKFDRLYTSIARGVGEMRREVPVICISNYVSLLSPLLSSLNVANKLTEKTKFLRGDGFVLQQDLNMYAVKAINKSAVTRAIRKQIPENITYKNDNFSNIKKLKGQNIYLCSILYNDKTYGIRKFLENDCLYCSENVDLTNKLRYTNSVEDIGLKWTLPPNKEVMRNYFQQGKFFYSSLEAKAAIIDMIHY